MNECTTNKVMSNSFLTVEIKDYNVMIDGKNFFDQPVKTNIRTFDKILKIATGQGIDYTSGFLLDYIYLKIVIRW